MVINWMTYLMAEYFAKWWWRWKHIKRTQGDIIESDAERQRQRHWDSVKRRSHIAGTNGAALQAACSNIPDKLDPIYLGHSWDTLWPLSLPLTRVSHENYAACLLFMPTIKTPLYGSLALFGAVSGLFKWHEIKIYSHVVFIRPSARRHWS